MRDNEVWVNWSSATGMNVYERKNFEVFKVWVVALEVENGQWIMWQIQLLSGSHTKSQGSSHKLTDTLSGSHETWTITESDLHPFDPLLDTNMHDALFKTNVWNNLST